MWHATSFDGPHGGYLQKDFYRDPKRFKISKKKIFKIHHYTPADYFSGACKMPEWAYSYIPNQDRIDDVLLNSRCSKFSSMLSDANLVAWLKRGMTHGELARLRSLRTVGERLSFLRVFLKRPSRTVKQTYDQYRKAKLNYMFEKLKKKKAREQAAAAAR